MSNSWFSHQIIEERLKNGSFLDLVDEFLNWSPILASLEQVHLRDITQTGRKPYSKIVMLKALLLQQWYNLSDVELENCLRDRLSFMRFCGLTLEESVPDHSTICRFRNKLINKSLHETIFSEINRQIENRGVSIKSGSAIDASLIRAHSRPNRRDYIELEPTGDEEQKQDQKPFEFTRVESKDPDARWIKKGKKSTYGYKANISVDITTGLVQSIITTSANVHDTKTFPALIDKLDWEAGQSVLADKGYSSKTNRELLREHLLKPFIMFKKYKNDPLQVIKTKFNKAISKHRYIVEQTFGCLHAHYGFGRTKFVGLKKTDYFLTMRCAAFNLKKSVVLLA